MKIYKISFLYTSKAGFILSFFFLVLIASCSKKNYPSLPPYQFTSANGIPDYSNLDFWAAHPWKWDPSDSVPLPLKKNYQQDTSVDIFFIHPTTLTGANEYEWNADINDQSLNSRTDYSTILFQASVFNESGRIFSPRYRQANLKAFFISDSAAASYFEIAYTDIKNAFEYYLTHYNGGRPIIISAHSQGTKHAARLLKEYFEGKPLMNKLVCAYLIGMPVPRDYFAGIPVCDEPGKTGCVISWRTFKSGYEGPAYVGKETSNMIVVNPLTWVTDESLAGKELNKGGILRKFNTVVPEVTSARVHDNILWAAKPDMPGKIFLIQKNYHIGDINLYYLNIRENVKQRVSAFWKK